MTACVGDYYELRPCQPKTQKLKDMLSECPYKGPEYEAEQDDDGSGEMESFHESAIQKKLKRPHKVHVGRRRMRRRRRRMRRRRGRVIKHNASMKG